MISGNGTHRTVISTSVKDGEGEKIKQQVEEYYSHIGIFTYTQRAYGQYGHLSTSQAGMTQFKELQSTNVDNKITDCITVCKCKL